MKDRGFLNSGPHPGNWDACLLEADVRVPDGAQIGIVQWRFQIQNCLGDVQEARQHVGMQHVWGRNQRMLHPQTLFEGAHQPLCVRQKFGVGWNP